MKRPYKQRLGTKMLEVLTYVMTHPNCTSKAAADHIRTLPDTANWQPYQVIARCVRGGFMLHTPGPRGSKLLCISQGGLQEITRSKKSMSSRLESASVQSECFNVSNASFEAV